MIVHCPVHKHSYLMPGSQPNFTTHIHTCSLAKQLEYDKDLEYNLYDVAQAKRVLADNIKIHITNPLAVRQDVCRAQSKSHFCMWLTGDP